MSSKRHMNTTRFTLMGGKVIPLLLLLSCWTLSTCQAWTPVLNKHCSRLTRSSTTATIATAFLPQHQQQELLLSPSSVVVCHMSTTPSSSTVLSDEGKTEKGDTDQNATSITKSEKDEEVDNKDENDDDDEEYEYIEYDILQESEFMGSEWLVGTCTESRPNSIEETWVRLATDKDGKNVAIWGDGAQGTWSLDVASQFLSMSKENFFGKNIWAGVVDDYYFTYGSVRGWSFLSPAEVKGQWQAKRLGVDPEEAGTAPWFEPEEGETEETEAPKLEATAKESADSEAGSVPSKSEVESADSNKD